VPTTTWRSLLTEIVGPFGLAEAATTTNIAANTAVVSTQLQSRYGTDSALNGMWLTVLADSSGTAASNANATRQITAYTASSGTIAVTGPAWAAESEAVDFLVTSVHPADAIRAFNRARQQSHPQVAIVRDVRTIVTGQHHREVMLPTTVRKISQVWIEDERGTASLVNNMLLNPDFEDWSSATVAENWAVTASGGGASANKETETGQARNYGVFSGSNSARIVVPDSAVTTFLQTVDMEAAAHANVASEGMEVNAEGMVHSNTASRVSIRLVSADGTAHTGTGWELITGSTDLGATAGSVSCGTVASSGTAMPYFVDSMTLLVGPDNPLQRNWDMAHGWEFIPAVDGESQGGRLMFRHTLPEKRRLRIIGTDVISAVTGVDSTVEVDGEQLDPLVWKTRQNLAQEGYSMSMFLGQTAAAGNTVSYCGRMYEEAINEGRRTHLPTQMQSVMPHYKVRR